MTADYGAGSCSSCEGRGYKVWEQLSEIERKRFNVYGHLILCGACGGKGLTLPPINGSDS